MFGNLTNCRSLLRYDGNVTADGLRVKSGSVILFWMLMSVSEPLKFVQQINQPSFCCLLIIPFVD
jgi:hypothetical protein